MCSDWTAVLPVPQVTEQAEMAVDHLPLAALSAETASEE